MPGGFGNGILNNEQGIMNFEVEGIYFNIRYSLFDIHDSLITDFSYFCKKQFIMLVLATKEDIAKLRSHTDEKINDLLKWNIVMWISQLAAIAALLKFFH